MHSLVASVYRETDRNNPPRVSGSAVVLDGNRFRNQTDLFQTLLQRASQSLGAEGENADRNIGIEGRESSIVPLAATLSGALSNTDGGVREGIRQKEVYASIGAGLENGTLRPLVGHEMPLASASDAH